jgi:hypothetical protein
MTEPHPLRLEGEFDHQLSRWLWRLRWLMVIIAASRRAERPRVPA